MKLERRLQALESGINKDFMSIFILDNGEEIQVEDELNYLTQHGPFSQDGKHRIVKFVHPLKADNLSMALWELIDAIINGEEKFPCTEALKSDDLI